ncbi:MAG: phospho-N-acetylmuramoyl-pentapeptide-transferase [Firmicutes bacterium]|nr:phospho-N-acetylmuramoyl-pentapeptide-transferase [Bacillota bacterium]
MLIDLLIALAAGFAISAVFGLFLVSFLRKIKVGQAIREDGPTWHMKKTGTPTMGGLMFVVAVAVVCLVSGWGAMRQGDFRHLYVLLLALIFGAVGFLDDYEKLHKKQNLGLKAKQKFLLQLVVALAFILLLQLTGSLRPEVYIPFWNVSVHIWQPLYIVLAAFIIVGTVNAVNITDGVDGLATGTTIPVCLAFAVIALKWGSQYLSMGIFASGLLGGLLGFLLYNFNPAKIFMGDTGSLFLGGAVCGLAFAMDMPLILIPLGMVYIIETLSDIIQVVYFKATHGKRFFKMAPLHHHLELGGWSGKKWSEKGLFVLFFSVSAIFAVISFLGVMNRF